MCRDLLPGTPASSGPVISGRSQLLPNHVFEVFIVLADPIEQIGIGHVLPRNGRGPRLGVGLWIINGHLHLHVPEIHTPEADCFLNGITRQTVLALARTLGYTVIERAMFPDELPKASEVFITGTAVEVTAVAGIDDRVYSVGPVAKALQSAYQQLVRA